MNARQHYKAIKKAWKMAGWMKRDELHKVWQCRSKWSLFKQAYRLERLDCKVYTKQLGIKY